MKKCGLPKIKNLLPAPKMKKPLDLQWEKEFEDGIAIFYDFEYHEIGLKENDLEKLFKTYLDIPSCAEFENNVRKVRIKVRKGAILIERI